MIHIIIPYLYIDPIALEVGALKIRWYGLAYMAGISLGWLYCRHLIKQGYFQFPVKMADDFIIWATLGIVIGGRLGQVFFYSFSYYLDHPLEILMLWHPGMSFHGGLIGVSLATFLYCRKNHLKMSSFSDLIACGVPFGLFFGRIANYINAELVGRVTDLPWATIFPGTDGLPRHPSQLYEAALEGIIIFIVLRSLTLKNMTKNYSGVIIGVFLFLYGIFRFLVEFVREPDADLGYFFSFLTLGQLLSLPLILFGAFYAYRRFKAKN
ncbi:MAG: prolipoprotein diacylglyceryl transferase [Caedimonadaceae bacterium]|nr:MAG: prolipoprotein diacylglyceryl transferase [Caedimonadaceae bacterium]